MKLRERYRRLNLWNKLAVWGSMASIAGLILTAVITMMPSSSQPQNSGGPSIELTFSPRSAVLGKVQARLSPDGVFEPVQMDVALNNKGDTRATGVAAMITFRRGMKVRSLDGRWRQDLQTKNYGVFLFNDPQVPLYADAGCPIGAFELCLPGNGKEEELLAAFQIHGDFGQKEGLLFYSPSTDTYRCWHTNTANEAFRRWNAETPKWNSDGSGG
ncbi:MAG: hypothetical protein JW955_23190 [Sedimentisphaerales bacterium]|nr:hypothetical protein [Sedimentisphaerales bacterium]